METMLTMLARGFRPFFLLAALQAMAGGILWIAVLAGLWVPPDPVAAVWHGQEMAFGFAAAVMAGFLLTAVQNWTGIRPAGPAGLGVLVLLWILARGVVWLPVEAAALGSALLDIAFLLGLSLAIAHPILRSRNRRNYGVPAIPAALALARGMTLGGDAAWVRPELGLELAVWILVWLMAFMGGRVIPFFTERRLPAARVVRSPRLDGLVMMLLTVLLPLWIVVGNDSRSVILVLLLSGLLLLARQWRWAPWASRQEPMLWILHLGHLWLALGVILMAIALTAPALRPADAIHALTTGALGALTLGMMVRVALGHTGRVLTAGPWLTGAFILVNLAAVLRLAAPAAAGLSPTVLMLSAIAWSLAFGLFAVRFAPVLAGPRVDGAPA